MPSLRDYAEKESLLLPGHRLCAGCGAPIAIKQILLASDKPVIATTATGCVEVATTIYPYTSWNIPWIHSAFENAAATASGIEAAIKALKRKGSFKTDVNIIAIAGDGGTYDIGFQALSGALERGHDFVYVLYDNEAYMNTGIQRSGGTPKASWTTTTPAGSVIPGKLENKKPISQIVVAHKIPYVATATPAHPLDLMSKAKKAFDVDGPAFLHVLSPCPRGWRYSPEKTIEIARLAVKTCLFPLWEAVDGKYKLSPPSKLYVRKPEKKIPLEEYLMRQGRYRHLFYPEKRVDIIEELQKSLDENWNELLELCNEKQ